MHVLASFNQHRRKSSAKHPRDLAIRKISFSGCSLSSEQSIESTSSSSTARAARSPHSPGQIDPLSSHPTYQQPPPRLFERPFIREDHSQPEVFYHEEAIALEESEEEELVCTPQEQEQEQNIKLPRSASPVQHSYYATQEPTDYFFMTFTSKRPPMPRSHWSDSTIQTIQSLDQDFDEDDDEDEESDDGDNDLVLSRKTSATLQAASLKRNTLPKRPPMKGMDSIGEFMKRGGWKRRGIFFQMEDMECKQLQ